MVHSGLRAAAVTNRARKKSVRKSREDRTLAIINAAREVFEEKGYEAATIVEIAERIDVVEGTVLHYFGSKRALVLAVMEDFYKRITENLTEQLKGVTGTRNQLHFVIWSHLKVLHESSALCAVILRESRNNNSGLAQDVHDKNRAYTNVVKNIIAKGIERGEIRPDVSPALVRNTIFGTTEHFLWDKVIGGAVLDLENVSEQLTNLIYRGISAGDDSFDTREVNQLINKLNALLPTTKRKPKSS